MPAELDYDQSTPDVTDPTLTALPLPLLAVRCRSEVAGFRERNGDAPEAAGYGDYSAWPGPNSNTFVQAALNSVPELKAVLPPSA